MTQYEIRDKLHEIWGKSTKGIHYFAAEHSHGGVTLEDPVSWGHMWDEYPSYEKARSHLRLRDSDEDHAVVVCIDGDWFRVHETYDGKRRYEHMLPPYERVFSLEEAIRLSATK